VRRAFDIPADATLGLGAIVVDEAILTGESVPIEKTGGDGLLSGTLVVQGTGGLERDGARHSRAGIHQRAIRAPLMCRWHWKHETVSDT